MVRRVGADFQQVTAAARDGQVIAGHLHARADHLAGVDQVAQLTRSAQP